MPYIYRIFFSLFFFTILQAPPKVVKIFVKQANPSPFPSYFSKETIQSLLNPKEIEEKDDIHLNVAYSTKSNLYMFLAIKTQNQQNVFLYTYLKITPKNPIEIKSFLSLQKAKEFIAWKLFNKNPFKRKEISNNKESETRCCSHCTIS